MLRIYIVKYGIISYILLASTLGNASNKHFPKIWNIQNYNRYFAGREEIINKIHLTFEDKTDTVSLIGVGGIGKTQIAKKFAELYRENYDIIWWFDAAKNLEDQYKNLSESWNEHIIVDSQSIHYIDTKNLAKQDIINKIKNNLRTTNLNYLIVFDNVINKEDIIPYIPEHHNSKRANVIITSRKINMIGEIIKVPTFKRKESIVLIEKLINDISKNESEKLAEVLYDYPLAISQAASYIKFHLSVTPKTYIELLKKDYKTIWKGEEKMKESSEKFLDITDSHSESLMQTINLTITKIKEQSEDTYKLLIICSLLNNNSIPQELLLKLNAENNNTRSELESHEALSLIEQYLLIEKNQVNSSILTYNIHEIIQKLILDQLDETTLNKYLNLLVKEFNIFLPHQIDLLVPFLEQNSYLLPHVIKIVELCKQNNIYNNEVLALNLRILQYYLPGERNFIKGNEYINNIEDIKKHLLFIDPLLKVRSIVMKAALLDWQDGNFKEAETILKEAVKIISSIEKAYEEKLMVYNRIAQTYQFLGDIEESIKYSDLGKKVIDSALSDGEYLGNQDAFYISRSRIKMDQGKLDEALENIKIAYSKLSDHYPFVGALFPISAMETDILLRKKNYKESYNKSTEMLEKVTQYILDSNHIYFGRIKGMLGYSLYGLNRLVEAQKAVEESIEIFKNGDYINTRYNAVSYMLFGMILMQEKKYQEAQKYFLQSEEIFEKIFVKKTIDDISRLYSMIVESSLRLNDDGLARYYATKHQEHFGYSHPRTFEIRDHLFNLTSGIAK
ncbi:NB-ARC domain protein [Rickettsiales bacterium Ac37b]|nr:NB-ARC domain protein [Rickettsiales bacterium Ac37b]